jgi:hypothetical protein
VNKISAQLKPIENEMIELGVYSLMVRGQGKDLLMGKNVKDYMPLPGLERLLHHFIADLDASFSFIYQKDIEGYLKTLQKKFNLNLLSLKENLLENIANMIEVDSDDIMIYYLVITKTLEFIREAVYEQKYEVTLSLYYEKIFKKKMNKTILEKIIEKDNSGDSTLSLMFNMLFIEFLADFYRDPEIQSGIQLVLREKLNQLFQALR